MTSIVGSTHEIEQCAHTVHTRTRAGQGTARDLDTGHAAPFRWLTLALATFPGPGWMSRVFEHARASCSRANLSSCRRHMDPTLHKAACLWWSLQPCRAVE